MQLSRYQLADPGALSGYLEEVRINKITPPARPVRNSMTSLESLTASIMEKGLLEPVLVRPNGSGFELVAGNRRLEACKRAGFKKVPCHVIELEDKEAYEVSLIENIQHSTFNPVEEAEAFKKYVDEYGYGGISELARKIGKSRTYVSRRISLLGLPSCVKDEIVQHRTSPSSAGELMSLNAMDRAEVAEFIVQQKLSTRSQVRSLTRRLKITDESKNHGNEDCPLSYYESNMRRLHIIDRSLAKCIAALKQSMVRFDDVMDVLGGEDEHSWVIGEALVYHRRLIHSQVDDLLRLRKKFNSLHLE